MQPILVLIARLTGTFNTIEAGTDTALRKGLDAPIWSVAVISLEPLAASGPRRSSRAREC